MFAAFRLALLLALFNLIAGSPDLVDDEDGPPFSEQEFKDAENFDFRNSSRIDDGNRTLLAAQDVFSNNVRINDAPDMKEEVILWDDGIIPYRISSDFNTYMRKNIVAAMGLIHKMTCVRFVDYQKNASVPYVHIITHGTQCLSHIGRQRDGVQYVNLGHDCFIYGPGIVIHELLHTLGKGHEHQRPDQEKYIRVQTGLIKQGPKNYQKREWGYAQDACEEYDFYSIMHYPVDDGYNLKYFDITVKSIPPVEIGPVDIGQRYTLSKLDAAKLNRMYKCGFESEERKVVENVEKTIALYSRALMERCRKFALDQRDPCRKMVAQLMHC